MPYDLDQIPRGSASPSLKFGSRRKTQGPATKDNLMEEISINHHSPQSLEPRHN